MLLQLSLLDQIPPLPWAPYIENPELLSICIIEKSWQQESSRQTTQNIFPSNFEYLLTHFQKTRQFYEFVLIDTDSIELSHKMNVEDNKITFSQVKLLQIYSLENWPILIHHWRSFSRKFQPLHYTYFDYIDAWYNILYLRLFSNSWFFWFKRKISLNFPKWFISWFHYFGPNSQIFSEIITLLFNIFKANTIYQKESWILSYFATFGISWIIT